jgi:hypothetical protein
MTSIYTSMAVSNHVTQNGQEPNGIKLSPKQSRNRDVVELQVSKFTIASTFNFSYLNAIRPRAHFA